MSDILKSVHKTAKGPNKAGAIDKIIMRQFEALCLTSIHNFTPEQANNQDIFRLTFNKK